MKSTKNASLDELRAMRNRGDSQPPKAGGKEIDLPDGFWDDAQVVMPKTKKAISLRVDPDILEFFKAQGNGHLTRIHAVLRTYVDAQKKKTG